MWPGFLKGLIGLKTRSVIQPAVRRDFAVLSEIHRASFPRGWGAGEFESLLAQDAYFCLVARKEGNVDKPTSGFILVKSVLDEAEIISIATKQSARKKGVAQQLLSAAVRKLSADRTTKLYLEVEAGNTAAINLYKKAGFREISRREGYYSDEGNNPGAASTALVMQLELG